MAGLTDRLSRGKERRRPKKVGTDRRRRIRNHQKRLIALGLPEAQVMKMDPKTMRVFLRRPAHLKKSLQAS